MTRSVTPEAVKEMIRGDGELAILDVREEGEFTEGHLLLACNVPISRFELLVRDLVPRHDVPVVLCDDGEGLVERAAALLEDAGYTDVAVLAGGVSGWRAAGFVVFTGVNVPSKAFGEFVEHEYHTPNISAEDLKAKMDAGEKIVVLDSRPMDEFSNMSIPTGIDVPGAELAYRVHDLAPDPDTTVVVNCAGRTRSIIGAQSLINAGIPNKVFALRNGTMGWHLAGFKLERGQTRKYPDGNPQAVDKALDVARRVGDRYRIERIDRAGVDTFRKDAGRSLFLLDVRSPQEFHQGHLPGSVSAPGGQLVQATDKYIGVLRPRVVLIDDTGVRATMTAHWLKQMGFEDVFILSGSLDGALETGQRHAALPELDRVDVEALAPRDLKELLDAKQAAILDVGLSKAFRAGHIEGSLWGVRSRLERLRDRLPDSGLLVIVDESDQGLARLAVPEVRGLTSGEVKVLGGGKQAWKAAGYSLKADRTTPTDEECIDFALRAYDRNSQQEEKMNEYLTWEVNLVNQIEEDRDVRFRARVD
ncbi:MAG: rhodanese-like domain-containing protein [Acetobacterales bacterium]